MEDVTTARGAPVWFQLYASPRWEVAQALIKRAEAAGCPVLVVTVDRMAGRNQETFFRLMRTDTRECSACCGRERTQETDLQGMISMDRDDRTDPLQSAPRASRVETPPGDRAAALMQPLPQPLPPGPGGSCPNGYSRSGLVLRAPPRGSGCDPAAVERRVPTGIHVASQPQNDRRPALDLTKG